MRGKLKMKKMIGLDILYLDFNKWFRSNFQIKNNIQYPAHGSAESRWQNDYINMYYEQKEKFDKKYLNKVKKNSKN